MGTTLGDTGGWKKSKTYSKFVLSCTQKMKSVIIWAACCSFGSAVEAPNHCMPYSYLNVICGVICKPNCDTVSCSFHIMVTPLLYWIMLGCTICAVCSVSTLCCFRPMNLNAAAADESDTAVAKLFEPDHLGSSCQTQLLKIKPSGRCL